MVYDGRKIECLEQMVQAFVEKAAESNLSRNDRLRHEGAVEIARRVVMLLGEARTDAAGRNTGVPAVRGPA